MHEVSLAEELVNECATLAQGRPVLVVAVRCPPGMGSSELSDSFAILAAQLAESGDACLRQAQLPLEEVPAVMSCRCGFYGELGPERHRRPYWCMPRVRLCRRTGRWPGTDGFDLRRQPGLGSVEGPTPLR